MIKWIMGLILVLVLNFAIIPLFAVSQQVYVTDELATAQVNDSDEVYIAMRANNQSQDYIWVAKLLVAVSVFGILLYKDRYNISTFLCEHVS